MSSISKKTKNIFKNKIVLYSVIAVTVIAIGIVVWGAVTDWKFWNTQKSSPSIPDYPIHHSCHPRFCKKCDISGERCEKGKCIEGTENINGYCFKTPTHPCSDKKCAKCSTDGKKCETCASGYVLDDNGKCCSDHEKINGVCCDEPCGGECCPKGKICMTSKRKNATGCCLPGQSLDNDGNCCPTDKIDDAGNCCDKGKLCGTVGNKFCCGNTGENKCEGNECKLTCGDSTCDANQNCEYVNGTKQCVTKSCEWNGDQTTYYPQLIYSTPKKCEINNECPYGICDQKTGLCQYYPIGLVPNETSSDDVLKKNVDFEEDAMNNPYLFLFASSEVDNKYRFSKVKSRSSTHTNIKCTENDCRTELGVDDVSETVHFNDKTSECLVEEETGENTIDPSSDRICPFKDETGDNSKRCCINDKGNWSGQVCDKGNECVYDNTKGIGTCLPYNTYTDQNGKICGEDDVQKGLNKITYKNENGKKIGYCDCGSGNEHLNEFKCTLPSGCFFPGIKNIASPSKKLCGDVGTCKESHSGYNCICPKYYDQDYYCEGSDTDDCRSDYSKGEVGDWLTGRYYLAYQEIALNRNGKCGDNNKICKDDCCNNIKEYCRHQITTDAGVKQCEKDRGC